MMFLKVKKVYKLQIKFPWHQIANCILWWFSGIISKSLWELWVKLRKSLAAIYFAFENAQYGKGKSSDYNSNFPHSQLCIIKRGQRPLPWLSSDRIYWDLWQSIPSTLNIDSVLWHTKFIVYAVKCYIMGYFFHFSSLYPAPYIELYMC